MWTYPAASTARDPLFDGAGMANAGVVFVNYNYRASSLGWLAHPQISEEFYAATGSNSSGNCAMLDQLRP
jgi:carboxylesterase 2